MPTHQDIEFKVARGRESDCPRLTTSLGEVYTVDAHTTFDGQPLTVAHIDRGPAKCYVLLSGISLRERESWQTTRVIERWVA